MQVALQEKFAFRNSEDGLKFKIIFRLPSGRKVEHHFLPEESAKVVLLYRVGNMQNNLFCSCCMNLS